MINVCWINLHSFIRNPDLLPKKNSFEIFNAHQFLLNNRQCTQLFLAHQLGKNVKPKSSLDYANFKIIQLNEYNYFQNGLNFQN